MMLYIVCGFRVLSGQGLGRPSQLQAHADLVTTTEFRNALRTPKCTCVQVEHVFVAVLPPDYQTQLCYVFTLAMHLCGLFHASIWGLFTTT
jgi:hypothetical protein